MSIVHVLCCERVLYCSRLRSYCTIVVFAVLATTLYSALSAVCSALWCCGMFSVPQWLIQTAVATNFYFYGRKHFTQTGWLHNSASYPKPDPFNSIDLRGRVYVVTGATSGLGKDVTSLLGERGATIYMVCRNAEKAANVLKEISAASPQAQLFALTADVGLSADVKRVAAELNEAVGAHGIDGLVCNAGALLAERTLNAEGSEVTLAIHLVHGTYELTNLLRPALERSSEPRVVVVSSGGMLTTKWPGMKEASFSAK